MSQEIEPNPSTPHRGLRTGLKIALIGGGIAAGAIGATALGASAATSTTGSTAAVYNASMGSNAAAAPGGTAAPGGPGGYQVPQLSGTVTAVGSASVTIRTSTATTTYQVTSASDIDKNGEAQLSNLVVGDAVTFNVMPNSASTINKLHAGDEAKDRPVGPPTNGLAPTG
ncbi:MAG: hypothetical protein M3N95_17975 [Actinomycetota bacterium]|nr:hypothetical protein [Actinomycetota bacterium]